MRNVFEVLRELLGLVKLVLEILKDLESRKRPRKGRSQSKTPKKKK